uniref:Thioredoxin domain-containing protein n=1 Tax=Caenorhabditis tropicalis TaxID=1561998 RepID=A0A1I7UXA4_9PELO
MLIQISSSSQFREVFKEQKTNDSPVYLYFYADWSGPSRMITPSFEDIAGDEKNEMVFWKSTQRVVRISQKSIR